MKGRSDCYAWHGGPQILLLAMLTLFLTTWTFLLIAADDSALPPPGNSAPIVATIRSRPEEGNQRRQLQVSFEINQMKQNFQVAKARFLEQLSVDYGPENIPLLFQTMYPNGTVESIARTVFEGSALSWDRIKRKVAIKILTAQISQTPQKFVWATGGHSASAGHGNLFNESYNAILNVKNKPIMEAVGIDFVARTYAMGSTAAGNEINCCIKEVFGLDVDALSWDYGMTTSRKEDKTELWFQRAAMLPNRPAFVAILTGFPAEHVEAWGPACFSLKKANDLIQRVPDTAEKGSMDEINKMPSYIRSFRCGSGVEKGEPTCDKEKYWELTDGDACNKRKGKASWHPGWKWHAFYGNLLTLFWIEVVDDALEEIARRGSDPRALFFTFQTQEEQEFEPMRSRNMSNFRYIGKQLQSIPDISNEVIYWGHNYCHTARLPAEIRYQGILTGSELKGGYDNYDQGSELHEIINTANEEMPVSWDRNFYQEFCTNYRVIIDHQDFLLVNSLGFSKLVLPNPTEKSAYGTLVGSPQLVGYIEICLAGCGWGCPYNTLSHQDLVNATTIRSRVSMKVNGVDVESFTQFDDCAFLKHAGGHQWTANGDGLFEISAITLEPSKYLRISSFVVW
ncbi:hypothetical protein ACA910_018983 [Epithemia clementina (nom. ined.)]